MINAIKVNLRKLFIGKTYLSIMTVTGVAYPFVALMFTKMIFALINQQYVLEMSAFESYSAYAALVIAFAVTKFFHSEFQDGVLRNKLVSGQKRKEVFLSACFVSSVFATITQIVSTLTIIVFSWITRISMSEIDFGEVMEYTFVTVLAGIAVAVFYSAFYLCHGNSKLAIAIPMGVSIFVKIVLTYIMDKLYPQIGVCKLTGTRLFVYQMIDKYSPYAYFWGEIRWSLSSYVIGSGLLILISLIIGMIVFQRKDLV